MFFLVQRGPIKTSFEVSPKHKKHSFGDSATMCGLTCRIIQLQTTQNRPIFRKCAWFSKKKSDFLPSACQKLEFFVRFVHNFIVPGSSTQQEVLITFGGALLWIFARSRSFALFIYFGVLDFTFDFLPAIGRAGLWAGSSLFGCLVGNQNPMNHDRQG